MDDSICDMLGWNRKEVLHYVMHVAMNMMLMYALT